MYTALPCCLRDTGKCVQQVDGRLVIFSKKKKKKKKRYNFITGNRLDVMIYYTYHIAIYQVPRCLHSKPLYCRCHRMKTNSRSSDNLTIAANREQLTDDAFLLSLRMSKLSCLCTVFARKLGQETRSIGLSTLHTTQSSALSQFVLDLF